MNSSHDSDLEYHSQTSLSIYHALRPKTPQLPKSSLSLASKQLSTWLAWPAPKAILPSRKEHPNSISEDVEPGLGSPCLPGSIASVSKTPRGSKGPKATQLQGAGSVVPIQYLVPR